MAKQKKNPDSGNPIIVNWVQSNEQKLAEIKTVNPELFAGMTMALDYLNKYLGGTSAIQMPEKISPEITVSSPNKVLTKELLDDTFILTWNFEVFQAIQEVLLNLGFEYRSKDLPKDWLGKSFGKKYSVQTEEDLKNWFDLKHSKKNFYSDYQKSLIGLRLMSFGEQYIILPQFAYDQNVISQYEREINVVDLGLGYLLKEQPFPQDMKIWLPPIKPLQESIQQWAFDFNYEWQSGKIVRYLDKERGFIFFGSEAVAFIESTDAKSIYEQAQCQTISLAMLNLKPKWNLDALYSTKIAIYNPPRDLVQVKNFLIKNGVVFVSEPTLKAIEPIGIIIDAKGQAVIVNAETEPFTTSNNTLFSINQMGLPLLEQEQMPEQKSGLSRYEGSSVLVGNQFESTLISNYLKTEFGLTPEISPNAPFPRFTNINSDGTFDISQKPKYSVKFTTSDFEFNKSPDQYKLTYESGDRYFFFDREDSSYIYDDKSKGLKTYIINTIAQSDYMLTTWASNSQYNQEVRELNDNHNPFKEAEFKEKIASGEILVIVKKPEYKEGQIIGNVKILAIGYDSNQNTFLYEIYRTDIDAYQSFQEYDLKSYLSRPSIPAPKKPATKAPKAPEIKEDVQNLYNELDDLDI